MLVQGTAGRFATASSPNWLGQYFCAFPAACSILTLKLVVKAMKTWPIQDGRRLTEHSKNYDSARDLLWSQSQHLISLFLCFLGVGAEACRACPTVKLVEQVCLDWKDKACKELFLLWQSAWRESSSETIAMVNLSHTIQVQYIYLHLVDVLW